MRIIVHGVGAIGGAIAAGLALSGQEVVGIARGAQLQAIRAHGLRLRRPASDQAARFDCVESPAEIALRPDDAILLTVKTQDSIAAMEQLRAAGVTDQPVFCVQNGVENERLALRRFANVHAATVMMPADFVTPGEIVVYGEPSMGLFDVGRYPRGTDAADTAVAEALTRAGIATFPDPEVMRSKYGKLLVNLGNIVDAALGRDADMAQIDAILQREGEAALTAAGIAFERTRRDDPRRLSHVRPGKVAGAARKGSSSAQSLARGAGSIETDYLNGEIVMLGRMHGVPTPANAWFLGLARRMLAERIAPGTFPRAEIEAALGLDAAGAREG